MFLKVTSISLCSHSLHTELFFGPFGLESIETILSQVMSQLKQVKTSSFQDSSQLRQGQVQVFNEIKTGSSEISRQLRQVVNQSSQVQVIS